MEIPKLTEFNKKMRKNFCLMNIKDELGNWVFSNKIAFQMFRNYQGLWTQDETIFIEKISPNSLIMIFAAICKYGKSPFYFFYEAETVTADICEKILSKALKPWYISWRKFYLLSRQCSST